MEKDKHDHEHPHAVAIVGMAGRFPGARNVGEFWENIANGVESVTFFSEEELIRAGADPERVRHPDYVKAAAFPEETDCFDAGLFGYTPREAMITDPAHRVFLECAWEALEDAGCGRSFRGARIGVFGGSGPVVASHLVPGANISPDLLGQVGSIEHVGNDKDYLCTKISYRLNLRGPSLTIQTACSTSLVAVHAACQSLLNGECDMALAGGVNMRMPRKAGYMVRDSPLYSPDGHCRPFDAEAKGTIFGSGAGIVLLKPLDQALADGDPVHAVILGSAVSNDGSSKLSYWASSADGLSDALSEALAVARAEPDTIGYVEAHGTGTELGDPVEVIALTRVFRQSTPEKQFCALGSVKSNIGHTDSASGVAGLIKTVMMLRHRMLAPTLHVSRPNPRCNFEKSPFFVSTAAKEWKTGRERRRAVVNSMGIGGTNACVVLEESPVPPVGRDRRDNAPESEEPRLVVLSARDADRLRAYARKLAEFLEEHADSPGCSLSPVAFTLQTGREAMRERLAAVVSDTGELREKLTRYYEGEPDIPDLYTGSVKGENKAAELLISGSSGEQFVRIVTENRELGKLAQLWVLGLETDWHLLYPEGVPNRISLPTYPFARERHRIPGPSVTGHPASGIGHADRIHPLLHRNTSDLSEQRFSSTFTGGEFFLADHVVHGERVLPGVAHLEMARAAVEMAAGVSEDGHIGIRLRNVVWARPVVAGDEPVRLHIGLFPEESGEIAYQIYTEPGDADAEPVVHSQGSALLSPASEVPTLDIEALKSECGERILSSDQCYETFRAMGIDYGPGHRGIEKVYADSGQALAKLTLPSSISDTQDRFVLHPSLTDSALQASAGLMRTAADTDSAAGPGPALPFALEELEIFGGCTENMWASVRERSGGRVRKLDIDLCDETGRICVRMRGFSSGALEDAAGSASSLGTLLLQPFWKEEVADREAAAPDYARHLVMLCEFSESAGADIEARMTGARCVSLKSRGGDIAERFGDCAEQVFAEIRGIIGDRPEANVLVQTVVPTEGEQRLFSGLAGLLKTARLENPKVICQLIGSEPGAGADVTAERLKENGRCPEDTEIRYQDGRRLVAGWKEIGVSPDEPDVPWKDGGVYLITGGAGGLGLIFAGEIAAGVSDATLILTGRSPLDEAKEARLKELEASGARIEYRQTDVTRKDAVTDLFRNIREEFGNPDGIIHGAGVIRDNFILRKTGEEFRDVLGPKVAGLVNLDEASKEIPLDFFIFFSSGAGATGNVGQADYACANAFMDAYAGYRSELADAGRRHGRTLSVDWPLWREGGMRVDEETEKMMRRSTGMIPMETATGISALYQGLASGESQVMVTEGSLSRMRRELLSAPTPRQPEKTSYAMTADTDSLSDNVRTALIRAVSELLRVRNEDIDADAELNEYGFDSITLTEFANKLNERYRLELIPTVFFEYPTLRSLAKYLAEEHRDLLAPKFATQTAAEPLAQSTDASAEKNTPLRKRRSRFAQTPVQPVFRQDACLSEPVAIVGMSGKFPMAGDVSEFWENLLEGRDCITEIPTERWDWRKFYGDPAKEANKTDITRGGFVSGVDEFDPLFFGISPREAVLMDPQQRLLMTYAWKAMEDAGMSARSLAGTKTAIFVGTGGSGYSDLISKAGMEIEAHSSTGIVPSVGPNRMSYFLDIHGPSEPVETACSSSLVALHRAVTSIETGACDMAMAGGVNTILTPGAHISFSKAGMLSGDGRCKTFSDQADGYVRAEGVGMLFLKRLRDAEQSGDHIYGVITGTAENHGGRASSLTQLILS
ncbi:SDR family NAD(P)-dependent oxidoreductase [Desulfobacterales bacterium HSG2]|nr:SDR family NAD(P)-dependent oxidoreductase [Desulfobacterales bacterium HSG2]